MAIDILEELNKQNWLKVRKILIGHATFKLKLLSFKSGKKEITDFVDDAIEKTFTGKRIWNPEKVELIYFLKKAIDSEISNHFKREEKTTVVDKDFENDINDYLLKSDERNPEEELILSERLNMIKENLKGDDEAGIVFECLQDGHKFHSICEELGINKIQFYNIIKRIKRKIKKFYEKQIE